MPALALSTALGGADAGTPFTTRGMPLAVAVGVGIAWGNEWSVGDSSSRFLPRCAVGGGERDAAERGVLSTGDARWVGLNGTEGVGLVVVGRGWSAGVG